MGDFSQIYDITITGLDMRSGGCSELYGYDCFKAEIYCMQNLYGIFLNI
jgi:hypothetical protein